MKKFLWNLLSVVLVALMTVGCAKETDLGNLKSRVDDLDSRVTALEEAVNNLNNEVIPNLQRLVNALNNQVTVVSVVAGDNGTYTITFSDGTVATIKDGKDGENGKDGKDGVDGKDGKDGVDGKDGKDGTNGKDGTDGKDGTNGKDGVDGKDGKDGVDGTTPTVSIAWDETLGTWVWVINGEIAKDGEGNPVPVVGPKGTDGVDGTDGVTPKFAIMTDPNAPDPATAKSYWMVSYDNGETWNYVGLADAGSFISAYIDPEQETDDYIVLVVGETSVQIPKEKAFSLVILYDGDLGSVGANAGDSISLEYEVSGVSASDEITVDILSASAGITAKVVYTEENKSKGYFVITIPDAETDPETGDPIEVEVAGKVFVFADNNKGKSNIKVISIEDGVITAVANVDAQVPATGDSITLLVSTNKEYNVMISDGDESWISLSETKAPHTDKLEIVVEPNTTGAYRVGTVSITDRVSGETIETFTIVQQPSDAVATDLGSIRELEDGTQVAGKDAIVLASSKEGALVVDENGAYLYLEFAENTAVRGDEVSFEGVKKTNEVTKVKYVEATSITVTASEKEVPDLPVYPMRIHVNYNSMNTGTTGILKKDDSGYYLDVSWSSYFPTISIEEPLGLDLSGMVDKYVTIKGYTNGTYVDYDEADNFTEDSYCNFIALSAQEVTFAVNPNWTLSYEGEEDGDEVILNTVSGGSDYYFNYQITLYPASEVKSLEEFSISECLYTADLTQYWFYRYNDDIDDDATTETSAIYGSQVDYGDYVAVVTGLNEDGFVSGKYAVLEFSKVDPHVALEYGDFLGQWNFGKSVITITQNVADESYYVTGFKGQEEAWVVDAQFDNGKLVVNEQLISGEAGDGIYLSGIFLSKYISYPSVNSSGPDKLFTVAALSDGTMEVLVGSNTKYGYAFDGFVFATYSGGKLSTTTSIVNFPEELTVYDPEGEPEDPLQADYTTDDYAGAITKDELFGTTWRVYCRPMMSGEYAADRGWYSNATVAEAEDVSDDSDRVSVSGLSLQVHENDEVFLEYYNGTLYYLTNSASWEWTNTNNGNTYYDRFCALNPTTGYFATGNYYNYFIKVADGILALVPNADGYTGFAYVGYDTPEFASAKVFHIRYKDVLLVNPAVITSVEALNKALSNVNVEDVMKASYMAQVSMDAKLSAAQSSFVQVTDDNCPVANQSKHSKPSKEQ